MAIFCPDKIKSRSASAQRSTARACLTSYSWRKKFLNSTRCLQSQDLKFHQKTDWYLSYLGRRDEIFQTVNSLAQMLGMVFQTETCRVQHWNTSQQENRVRRRQNQNLVDLAVWSWVRVSRSMTGSRGWVPTSKRQYSPRQNTMFWGMDNGVEGMRNVK